MTGQTTASDTLDRKIDSLDHVHPAISAFLDRTTPWQPQLPFFVALVSCPDRRPVSVTSVDQPPAGGMEGIEPGREGSNELVDRAERAAGIALLGPEVEPHRDSNEQLAAGVQKRQPPTNLTAC